VSFAILRRLHWIYWYIGCTQNQAQAIIELRPFDTVDDLKEKFGQQGKKKWGAPKGVSSRMFDDCVEIFRGYGAVDDVLAQCERIGGQLNAVIASWSQDTRKGKERASSDTMDENGSLSLVTPVNERALKDIISEQPNSLSKNVQLKGYQLLGVNWLRLLYKKGRSCILADEMGTILALRLNCLCSPRPQVWERLSRSSVSSRTLRRMGRKGPILLSSRES
jgi:SWI/SNF-related matrix-associated actin-dependent regulator 1 of chromatin subfamily A